MMKRIISLIGFLFVWFVSTSQTFDVNLLPEKKGFHPMFVSLKNSFYTFSIDMQGQSGFSANVKRFMHNITIKKYNGWMEEELSVRVSAPDKNFGPVAPILKVMNEKLFLLYFKMGDKGKMSMFISSVDTSNLELSDNKEILKIEEEERYIQFYLRSEDSYHPNRPIIGGIGNGTIQPNYTFFINSSADGSKYLFAWTSGWSRKLYFSITDNGFNVIRSRAEELPDESTLSLSNVVVDNNSNAYIAYVFSKKGKIKGEILIDKSSGSEKRSVELSDVEIAGCYSVIDEKRGKFWVLGTYKDESGYQKGVFVQPFAIDGFKAGGINKTPFSENILELLDKDGWAKNKEKKSGLYNSISFETMLLEDGSLNMNGEFREVVSGVRTSFIISGSILNIRFDESNKTAFFTRIPKVRVSAGSTIGDSYRSFVYKDKIFIFYDDVLKNLELELSASPKRSDVYTNAVLAVATISETGELKREIVKDLSKEDFLGITDCMQEISKGEYFIPFRRIKSLGQVTNDIRWAFISVK